MLLKRRNQSGQTLVIIMLILVVVLTIGLSAVTRTITNVKETTTTEKSSRAFSAAEAGVESTLRQDLSTLLGSQSQAALSIDIGTGKSNVTISKSGGTAGAAYQPAKAIEKDDTIQVNLDGYTGGTLDIYWTQIAASDEYGNGTINCTPIGGAGVSAGVPASLAVTIIDKAYAVTRKNYNASACASLNAINGFTDPASSDSNSPAQFLSKATIAIPANAALMRIRPVYTKATVRVVPPSSATLPVQAYKIRSEGVTGDTKRVVEVEKSIGSLPSIFDYVIYNGSVNALTK